MSHRPVHKFKSKAPSWVYNPFSEQMHVIGRCSTTLQPKPLSDGRTRAKRKFFMFQRCPSPLYNSEKENSNSTSQTYLLYLISSEQSSWNTTKTYEMLITPQHLATKMATFLFYVCAWRVLINNPAGTPVEDHNKPHGGRQKKIVLLWFYFDIFSEHQRE